jgi:DNA-directed RNA polymerase specialized sigma subunit
MSAAASLLILKETTTMKKRKTYTATATREGRYWVLDVGDLGTTQALNLDEAQEQVRSLVSLMTEIPADSFDVAIVPELDKAIAAELAATRAAVDEVAARQVDVARRQRELVRSLVDVGGLSRRDAAVVLGVSHQRVSQILAAS